MRKFFLIIASIVIVSLVYFSENVFAVEGGYYLKPVYFVAKDVAVEPDYEAKMQTGIELVMRFYGEEMRRNGFGYKLFNVELDTNGRPKIYFIRGRENLAYYHPEGEHPNTGDGQKIIPEIRETINLENSVVWLESKNSGWHGMRYVDYGGVGSAPQRFNLLGRTIEEQMQILCDQTVADADGNMRGHLAGIELGGIAHELGHAFGLPHHEAPDIMGWHHNFGAYYASCTLTGPYWAGVTYPPLSFDDGLIINNSRFLNPPFQSYADNIAPTLITNIINRSVPQNSSGIPVTITASDGQSGLGALLVQVDGANYGSNGEHYRDLRQITGTTTFTYTFVPSQPLVAGTEYLLSFTLYDKESNRSYRWEKFQVSSSSISIVTPASSPTPNPSRTPTPSPTQNTFSANDRVRVNVSSLNIRSSPGGAIVGSVGSGALGTVVGGPTSDVSGVRYWQIAYDSSSTGWSQEGDIFSPYLVKVAMSATPTSTPQSTPSRTPTPTQNTFSANDRVRVNVSSLNIRSSPGGNKIGSAPPNAVGTIVGGPIISGNYIWWKISYNNGLTGYSAQGNSSTLFMAKTNDVTTSGTPAPESGVASSRFIIGDRARVSVSALNVRTTPNGPRNGIVTLNTPGVIIGGPVNYFGYIWWKISYYNGELIGWSAESSKSVNLLIKI